MKVSGHRTSLDTTTFLLLHNTHSTQKNLKKEEKKRNELPVYELEIHHELWSKAGNQHQGRSRSAGKGSDSKVQELQYREGCEDQGRGEAGRGSIIRLYLFLRMSEEVLSYVVLEFSHLAVSIVAGAGVLIFSTFQQTSHLTQFIAKRLRQKLNPHHCSPRSEWFDIPRNLRRCMSVQCIIIAQSNYHSASTMAAPATRRNTNAQTPPSNHES